MRFVIPGKDLTCKPAAVTDLVALLSRPQADGGQVPLSPLPVAPGPPSASPVTTHPATVFNIRSEELLKLEIRPSRNLLLVDAVLPSRSPPTRGARLVDDHPADSTRIVSGGQQLGFK